MLVAKSHTWLAHVVRACMILAGLQCPTINPAFKETIKRRWEKDKVGVFYGSQVR